jgi:hypothetical protein
VAVWVLVLRKGRNEMEKLDGKSWDEVSFIKATKMEDVEDVVYG